MGIRVRMPLNPRPPPLLLPILMTCACLCALAVAGPHRGHPHDVEHSHHQHHEHHGHHGIQGRHRHEQHEQEKSHRQQQQQREGRSEQQIQPQSQQQQQQGRHKQLPLSEPGNKNEHQQQLAGTGAASADSAWASVENPDGLGTTAGGAAGEALRAVPGAPSGLLPAAPTRVQRLLQAGRARCSFNKCPDKSKCTLFNNSPTCVCPAKKYSRILNGKCSAYPLRHWGWIDPHNHARAALGVRALRWDSDLAAQAQAWADTLAQDGCQLALGGHPDGVGQNVANRFQSTKFKNVDAVNQWVSQGGLWNYARFVNHGAGGCITGDWRNCAAYTQLIWNNSKTLGCGVGRCPNQKGKVYVCNYWPTGNINGKFPYQR